MYVGRCAFNIIVYCSFFLGKLVCIFYFVPTILNSWLNLNEIVNDYIDYIKIDCM